MNNKRGSSLFVSEQQIKKRKIEYRNDMILQNNEDIDLMMDNSNQFPIYDDSFGSSFNDAYSTFEMPTNMDNNVMNAPNLYTNNIPDNNNNNIVMTKTEDVVIHLKVDLVYFCTNIPIKLNVVRNRLCGMCYGTGKLFEMSCHQCSGNGVNSETISLQLFIKGRLNGDELRFEREGDQKLNYIPGDIVVILHEQKHNIFERKGFDLYLNKKIHLFELLCNENIYFRHINGDILKFKLNVNEINYQNNFKCIKNFGVPCADNINKFGDLYIYFDIIFPKTNTLNPHIIKMISCLLPKKIRDKKIKIEKEIQQNPTKCKPVTLYST